MKRLCRFFLRISQIHKLKYVIVVVFAVAMVGFLDENSVWNHYRNKRKIAALENEIQQYTEQYLHDNSQLHKLARNPKEIEKIARERYFMKTDDEDIFVLSDDQQAFQQNPDKNETTE